jgi:putative membrane protein
MNQDKVRLTLASLSTAALATTATVVAVPHATASGDQPARSPLNAQDRTYLHDSAQGDLLEVRGGRLAVRKTDRAKVEAFGHRMVRDHSREYRETRKLGREVGYAVPTRPSRGERRVLTLMRSLAPHSFPCAYIAYEWEDHQLDIADAQDEIKDGRNPKVIQDARQALPMLRKHLHIVSRILNRMPGC